jgi:hypothetical protein
MEEEIFKRYEKLINWGGYELYRRKLAPSKQDGIHDIYLYLLQQSHIDNAAHVHKMIEGFLFWAWLNNTTLGDLRLLRIVKQYKLTSESSYVEIRIAVEHFLSSFYKNKEKTRERRSTAKITWVRRIQIFLNQHYWIYENIDKDPDTEKKVFNIPKELWNTLTPEEIVLKKELKKKYLTLIKKDNNIEKIVTDSGKIKDKYLKQSNEIKKEIQNYYEIGVKL